jgi:hypothetical protein
MPTAAILAISEDRDSLWHAPTGHTKVSSIPHVAKLTLVPETFKSAVNDTNNIETISARREVQRLLH